MHECAMSIGGRPAPSLETFDVEDPATGQVIGAAPLCSPEQLETAMTAASEAFARWRVETARAKLLTECASAIEASSDSLARLITSEQGKPLAEARREVMIAADWFSYYGSMSLEPFRLHDDKAVTITVHHVPLGVVAAITPWNFPIGLAAWKIAPALGAGNTVVIKPSPYTPMSTLELGRVLQGVLPPGTLNVVSGGDRLGALMTEHPVPRKVTFTGSVRAGRQVASSAASDLKRLTLELGGNDAAILLDEVDLEYAIDRIFRSAFSNCGQVCAAVKRVYVPSPLYDEACARLVDRASSLRIGPGLDPRTDLGPLTNAAQVTRITTFVEDAVAAGGIIATGGRRIDRDGYFYAPTVLANANHQMSLVSEEQFGPVLPLIEYNGDPKQAVEMANATRYGLGGSVWSRDEDAASDVARELHCGTVWINSHTSLAPDQPFGGHGYSGLGTENGIWGLESFTDLQVRHVTKLSSVWNG